MTVKRTDKRFKILIGLMCVILLLSSIYPALSDLQKVNAADRVVYFDTSCTGADGSNHGWSKTMTNVYYYAYSSSGHTNGLQAMTSTGKFGKDGGKLFTANVDSSYTSIIFSSVSEWTSLGNDYRWQTTSLGLSGTEGKAFILNNSGIYDNEDGTTKRKQGMYTYTIPAAVSYAGQKFSVLNMTNSAQTLYYRFTDEQKSNGVWAETSTFNSGSKQALPLAERFYDYEAITVPADNANGPYTTVEIYDSESSTTPINKYFFEEGKILGRTYEYGVSELTTGKISYQAANPVATKAVNEALYLEKSSFKTAGTTVEGKNTTAITKSGNASYVTDSAISVSAYTTLNTDTDMSSMIITATDAGGNKYNMFGPENEGDNLITINDNVAIISGKYTVQSTDNKMDNGQKYITVKADFFDYQYDHVVTGTLNDLTYSQNYNYILQDMTYVVFQNQPGWDKVYVHYWGGWIGSTWPGVRMSYFRKGGGTSGNQYDEYIFAVPKGTTGLIFNNNSGLQTPDITFSDTGNNCFWYNGTEYGSWKDTTITGLPSTYADAKRPYLAVNEAISKSDYGTKSSYPMYMGQFWLPVDSNSGYTTLKTSSNAYSTTTAAAQRAAHVGDDEKYVIKNEQESGAYTNFGFGEKLNNFTWPANLAFRTETQTSGTHRPYDVIVQGLVNAKLSDGKLMDPGGNYSIPYFDYSWWTSQTSFTTSQQTSTTDATKKSVNMANYINYYKDGDFPFFEINSSQIKDFSVDGYDRDGKMLSDRSTNYSGTYYVFDSKEYSIRVTKDEKGNTEVSKSNLMHAESKNNDMVYDNYGDDGNGANVGLFPFNDPADGGNKSQKLHYGYGIEYDIEFYINENGTIDGTADGVPITFTFQGDDDVWVFLDDELVLDMGGAHKNAIGEINFHNKKTFISAIGNAGNPSIVSSNITNQYSDETNVKRSLNQTINDFSNAAKERVTVGKHRLRMYYMERGMLNSNLYVMFNLPMSLTRLDIQEDTDFKAVNAGFADATKYVADYDVFNYTVENKGTTNVVGSDYKTPSNTAVTRSNEESGTARTTTLAASGSSAQHKYDYKGSPGDNYVPMISDSGGVTYSVADPFTSNKTVTFDTRSVTEKNVEKKGVISLQYGEIATFNKQLNYGTGMRVTQLDTLSAPNGTSRTGSYNDNTGRTASKYYNTYMKSTPTDENSERRLYAGLYDLDHIDASNTDHVENLYNGKTNYSMNNVVNLQVDGTESKYNFNDPTDGANEYVHLRQVIVNEVKTVDLTIRKDFVTTETYTSPFSFEVHFSNVFGSTAGDTKINVGAIKYYKNGSSSPEQLGSDGSFELAANDYIVIKGIPVGTKFYVKETSVSETYELYESKSFNLGDEENPLELENDTETYARNIRKLGRLTVNKAVYGTDHATLDTTDTTPFTAVVSLTAPSGVNIKEFDIKANGEAITFNDDTTDFNITVSRDKPVVITGLPYQTTYTITEDDPPAGYTKHNVSGTNITYADSESGGVEQKIDNQSGESATIMNEKVQPVGSLTVKKLTFNTETENIMTGVEEEFPITIELSGLSSDISSSLDCKWNGSALDSTKLTTSYSGGTLTLTATIKPGDRADDSRALVISNIPEGTTYNVSENESTIPQNFAKSTKAYTGSAFKSTPAYTTSSGSYNYVLLRDTAKSIGGSNDYVVVENEFTPLVMPATGGTPIIFLLPFGIIAIALSGAALMIYKKKLIEEIEK